MTAADWLKPAGREAYSGVGKSGIADLTGWGLEKLGVHDVMSVNDEGDEGNQLRGKLLKQYLTGSDENKKSRARQIIEGASGTTLEELAKTPGATRAIVYENPESVKAIFDAFETDDELRRELHAFYNEETTRRETGLADAEPGTPEYAAAMEKYNSASTARAVGGMVGEYAPDIAAIALSGGTLAGAGGMLAGAARGAGMVKKLVRGTGKAVKAAGSMVSPFHGPGKEVAKSAAGKIAKSKITRGVGGGAVLPAAGSTIAYDQWGDEDMSFEEKKRMMELGFAGGAITPLGASTFWNGLARPVGRGIRSVGRSGKDKVKKFFGKEATPPAATSAEKASDFLRGFSPKEADEIEKAGQAGVVGTNKFSKGRQKEFSDVATKAGTSELAENLHASSTMATTANARKQFGELLSKDETKDAAKLGDDLKKGVVSDKEELNKFAGGIPAYFRKQYDNEKKAGQALYDAVAKATKGEKIVAMPAVNFSASKGEAVIPEVEEAGKFVMNALNSTNKARNGFVSLKTAQEAQSKLRRVLRKLSNANEHGTERHRIGEYLTSLDEAIVAGLSQAKAGKGVLKMYRDADKNWKGFAQRWYNSPLMKELRNKDKNGVFNDGVFMNSMMNALGKADGRKHADLINILGGETKAGMAMNAIGRAFLSGRLPKNAQTDDILDSFVPPKGKTPLTLKGDPQAKVMKTQRNALLNSIKGDERAKTYLASQIQSRVGKQVAEQFGEVGIEDVSKVSQKSLAYLDKILSVDGADRIFDAQKLSNFRYLKKAIEDSQEFTSKKGDADWMVMLKGMMKGISTSAVWWWRRYPNVMAAQMARKTFESVAERAGNKSDFVNMVLPLIASDPKMMALLKSGKKIKEKDVEQMASKSFRASMSALPTTAFLANAAAEEGNKERMKEFAGSAKKVYGD